MEFYSFSRDGQNLTYIRARFPSLAPVKDLYFAWGQSFALCLRKQRFFQQIQISHPGLNTDRLQPCHALRVVPFPDAATDAQDIKAVTGAMKRESKTRMHF